MASRYPSVQFDLAAISALKSQNVNARSIYVNASTDETENTVSRATSVAFGDGSNTSTGQRNAILSGENNNIAEGTNAAVLSGNDSEILSEAVGSAIASCNGCILDQQYSVVLASGEFSVPSLPSSYKQAYSTYVNHMYMGGNKVFMVSLPTSDPAVAGQLWNDGGVVTISSGGGDD